jgi:uncharacterized protein YggT (Ycf19 family)
MEIFIVILKSIGIACFIQFFLIFMVWPVNDDQNQAPAWVICGFIKKVYAKLTNKG